MRVPALRKSGRTKLKAFRKPGAATLFMFLGCFLVLPLAPLVHWLQRRLAARSRRGSSSGSSVCGNGNGGASEPLLADGATEQQPARTAAFVLHQAALVAIPTCFTVVATVREAAAAACVRGRRPDSKARPLFALITSLFSSLLFRPRTRSP